MLDAARLQEEDAEYANRKGFSRHRPALPLYTEEDVRDALRHLRPVDYDGQRLDLGGGMWARFQDAGHILGSASVEVKARGGRLIAVVNENDNEASKKADDVIIIPAACHHLTPILLTIPLQMLAYHIAVLKGTDVDQPRNLAKSVTVE